jgi:F-type H+-transporting ATPase subunit epsilon
MRVVVTTPLATVVDASDVVHVRAEDETGAFGLLEGHTSFLTVLEVSVLSWRDWRGAEHHVAVRGGMLEMRGGALVAVATSEAVAADDLHVLESEVLVRFRTQQEAEQAARVDAQRLHLAAIRQIVRLLRPERSAVLR